MLLKIFTAQKMNFSIKRFSVDMTKSVDILKWSHLLKKSLTENLIFCAVFVS